MNKFLEQMIAALTEPAMQQEMLTGIWETIYSTVAATVLACALAALRAVNMRRRRRFL